MKWKKKRERDADRETLNYREMSVKLRKMGSNGLKAWWVLRRALAVMSTECYM